jgi:hypothetical protein
MSGQYSIVGNGNISLEKEIIINAMTGLVVGAIRVPASLILGQFHSKPVGMIDSSLIDL